MFCRSLVYFAVLALLSVCLGCDEKAPTKPTATTSAGPATLAIRAFSVSGRSMKGRFLYWPKLTLAETTGRIDVSIVSVAFELLDVGPAGRVPPYLRPILVPAGKAIVLNEGDYGEPWLEIDSEADASRVSVVVSFVNDTGHDGVVSAVAQVSR